MKSTLIKAFCFQKIKGSSDKKCLGTTGVDISNISLYLIPKKHKIYYNTEKSLS